MVQVRLDEARDRLPALVRAAMQGEKVFIEDDEQIVQLVPIRPPERQPRFGSAKGLIVMTEDFDAPLEDFAGYMP